MKNILIILFIFSLSISTPVQSTEQLDSLFILPEKNNQNRLDKYLKLASYYAKTDSEKSMNYTDQAMNLSRKMEDNYWQGIVLFNSALNSYIWCDYTKTLKTYINCLNIFHELDSTRYIFKVYSNMGTVYNRIADHENELYYYLKADSIHKEAIHPDNTNLTHSEILKLYNNIAIVYQRTEQYKLALDYYNKALLFAKKNNDFFTIASININIARHYIIHNEMKQAELFLKDAMLTAKKSNAPEKVAATHVMYMFYLLSNEKSKPAIEHGKKALNLIRESEFKDIKRNIHQYLYYAYKAETRYDKALFHFEMFKKYYDAIIDKNKITNITKIKMQYEYDKKQKVQEILANKRKQTNLLYISILSLVALLLLFLFITLRRRTQLISQEKRFIETQLETKNKELTSKLLNSSDKNNLINSVVEKLNLIKVDVRKKESDSIQKVIWELNSTLDHDLWEEFELVFKEIHTVFYKRLHEKYPKLSPSERRLAAFLRLNFTTKEIAKITGQSTRSLEVARYRLRKDLGITNQNINLVNFLHNLDSNQPVL